MRLAHGSNGLEIFRCDGCDTRTESHFTPDGWVWIPTRNPHFAQGHYCTKCYADMRAEMLNPTPRESFFGLLRRLWSSRHG